MGIIKIRFSAKARKHMDYWKKTNNIKIQERISLLIEAVLKDPFRGIGKPEPLKHHLAGKWARRIDTENRFVYKVEGNILLIFSLKGHYE